MKPTPAGRRPLLDLAQPAASLRTVNGESSGRATRSSSSATIYDKGASSTATSGHVTAVERQREAELTAEFDGDSHVFSRGEFGDLALAYCITIHKSQGSEYPVVIIPLLKAHFMMLQRNLIYTAITRGKKKVFLVGEPAAYSMAVRNSESKQRVTHLREKITASG